MIDNKYTINTILHNIGDINENNLPRIQQCIGKTCRFIETVVSKYHTPYYKKYLK